MGRSYRCFRIAVHLAEETAADRAPERPDQCCVSGVKRYIPENVPTRSILIPIKAGWGRAGARGRIFPLPRLRRRLRPRIAGVIQILMGAAQTPALLVSGVHLRAPVVPRRLCRPEFGLVIAVRRRRLLPIRGTRRPTAIFAKRRHHVSPRDANPEQAASPFAEHFDRPRHFRAQPYRRVTRMSGGGSSDLQKNHCGK